jgi:DNA invertase Pin-like site-specific DNA recombinase
VTKRVAIYTRVSTGGQSVQRQLDALHEAAKRHGWEVVGVFNDVGVSGTKTKRPALDKLMDAAQRREFDVVAIWAFDRLGRSLEHLLRVEKELRAKRIGLYSHTQAVDTSTPAGEMMFQVMGSVAQFERALILERVTDGIAKAKRHGTRSGKPIGRPAADPAVLRKIRALHAKGGPAATVRAIAAKTGASVGLVHRVVSEAA